MFIKQKNIYIADLDIYFLNSGQTDFSSYITVLASALEQ